MDITMGMMRNLGLMIHHMMNPSEVSPDSSVHEKNTVIVQQNMDVQEEKINENVTVRRTIIEEIELRKPNESASNDGDRIRH